MAEKQIDWAQIFKKYGIIFILCIMVIAISIAKPNFLSSANLFNVLTQSSIFGILSLGVTLAIISKGIDLSLGSVLALSGVIAASFAQTPEAVGKFFPSLPLLPAIIPILIALLFAALCGAINGGLIAYTGIPAFIATLGMFAVARGLALLFTGGRPVSTLSSGFTVFGDRIGFLPMPVLVYGVMVVITW